MNTFFIVKNNCTKYVINGIIYINLIEEGRVLEGVTFSTVLIIICLIIVLYFVVNFAVKNALKESVDKLKALMEESTLTSLNKHDYDKKE